MKQNIKNNIPNFIFYTIGILVAAFGISLMKKSGLGLGPFGVAAIELQMLVSKVIPFFTFGMASSFHTYLMFGIILIVNKNFKSIFVVLSVFFINGSVDLFDLFILKDFIFSQALWSSIIGHSVGFIAYCFGSAGIILSRLPGLVLEEFTFSMMKLTKSKNYVVARIVVSYSALILAFGYSFFTSSGLTSLTVLTIVQGFAFGPAIGWVVKFLKQKHLPERFKLVQNSMNI
jgi:uncharacterized membrane protein YczE